MNASASIDDYFASVRQTLTDLPQTQIRHIVDLILATRAAGGQIFVFGNGGSAATASHFACDLGKGTVHKGKRRFRVISLCDQIPMMTAWANDANYSDIFVEQLANLLNKSDLVIGISSSGNSPNVLKALQFAKAQGVKTVALSGFNGGRVREIVDECLIVPSSSVQIIEDIHLMLEHVIFLQICAKVKLEPAVE
jgi:D-sedoheptulose 7-phosphate isomerase